LVLALTVVVLAFTWPSVTSEPRNLPIAISGSDDAVAQVESSLAEASDGAIALQRVDDRTAAVAAIEERDVYGAVILPAMMTDAPEVLIASAANPAVAQILTGLAAQLQAQIDGEIFTQLQTALQQAAATLQALAAGQPPASAAPPSGPSSDPGQLTRPVVQTTDIVPLADSDPRGTGLSAAMFPLLLGGMIGGVGLTLLISGRMRRVAGVVIYAATGGLLLAGILQGWYGALQGDYWLNALAISLTLLAIAATIIGLAAVLGRPGLALGAITFVLVANPISAASVPVEFLAQPWGAVGQWFPPGAAATLLRDLSYFPSADTTFPWLVLAGWASGGILLSLLGKRSTEDQEAKVRDGAASPVSERAAVTR
jgi:hypothetical protein